MNYQPRTNTQHKYVSILVAKAWIPTDSTKGFSIAPITVPVEGKKGEFQVSDVYPFIADPKYTRISFGPNKSHDPAKNNNTHWVFLEIREDKLPEYEVELAKIGQKLQERTTDEK